MKRDRTVLQFLLVSVTGLCVGGCGRIGYDPLVFGATPSTDAGFSARGDSPKGASGAEAGSAGSVDANENPSDTANEKPIDTSPVVSVPVDAMANPVDTRASVDAPISNTGGLDLAEPRDTRPPPPDTSPQPSPQTPTTVTTFTGAGPPGFQDGNATTATFRFPNDVLWTPEGMYVADQGNFAIRLVDRQGTVTTVTGRAGNGFRDGPASTGQLRRPVALARDQTGRILVADDFSHAIRRMQPDGSLTTVVGNGTAGYREGKGAGAQFNEPRDIFVEDSGSILVTDKNNAVIRRIDQDGNTTLVCGQPGARAVVDGACGGGARFDLPTAIEGDGKGNLYITDWDRNVIRKLSRDGQLTTVLGNATVRGWADGPAATTVLSRPSALRWDPTRGLLWFLEHEGGHRLRHYDGTRVVTLFGPRDPAFVAGDFRDGADPRFGYPEGLDIGPDGCVYIADLGNNRVRRACAGP